MRIVVDTNIVASGLLSRATSDEFLGLADYAERVIGVPLPIDIQLRAGS